MTNHPLKWHGGKGAFHGKLARWIISLMPPHTHYVEPYFGGGAVLLEKDPEGVSEVANDIHGDLMAFWSVLRDESLFQLFHRRVSATPFSEPTWEAAAKWGCDRKKGESLQDWWIRKAVRFFIHCRQSRAGKFDEFATLSRNRVRRGMNEQVSAWLSCVEGLPAVHARLKRVVLFNREALDVIYQQDGPKTLFYCDPPYLHETRVSKDAYAYEMTEDQHGQLLNVLAGIAGKFLLSGYHSELYDDYAADFDWHCTEFDLPNNAAGGKKKRRMIECVWTNYEPLA